MKRFLLTIMIIVAAVGVSIAEDVEAGPAILTLPLQTLDWSSRTIIVTGEGLIERKATIFLNVPPGEYRSIEYTVSVTVTVEHLDGTRERVWPRER